MIDVRRPLPRLLSRQRLHHGVSLMASLVQNQRMIRCRFDFFKTEPMQRLMLELMAGEIAEISTFS